MIDRKIAPVLRPTGKPELIQPRKVVLDNGLPVYLLNAGTQDVCKIDFTFEAGTWQQHNQLEAAMCNAMLQEGSEQYSAVKIAEVFDFHGAYLQLMADHHYGIVSLICLTKHLSTLLPVIEDLIKKSTLPENEFETLMQRRKQRFLLENEKVKVLCQKKFSEVLFGEGHPYAQTLRVADFESLQRESLIDFYRKYYHAGNCEISVAGLFDDELISWLNSHFGGSDWVRDKEPNSVFSPNPFAEKLVRVQKADSIQSAIRMGKMLVRKDHPDYNSLQVLVTILGGYFSSRLMANIREKKGYTYGIGASFFSLNEDGYLVIATEVDKNYEQATVAEVLKEIKKLTQVPVEKEELDRVRQYLLGEFVRDLDGPFALAQAFRNVHDFGLDYAFYEDYYRTLLEITPAKLQQLAQKYFEADSIYTVIAGHE